MIGFIYKLVFANGKCYIGQTRQSVRRRFFGHRASVKAGRTSRVYAAWRKYGEPACIQLGQFSIDELDTQEINFIEYYGTLSPHGYNLETGGNAGFAHPETREKIRAAGLGRKHSDASKARIGTASKARMSTFEQRTRLAERNKSFVWTDAERAKVGQKSRGRKHSAEVKARIGAASRARGAAQIATAARLST
jgi:group I intron endonuclease